MGIPSEAYLIMFFVCVFAVTRSLSFFYKKRRKIAKNGELLAAEELLKSRGFRACVYLPSAGIEDEDLANACRLVSIYGNRIILAEDNYIVGKVSPDTLEDNDEGDAPNGGPKLRLVVSNPD